MPDLWPSAGGCDTHLRFAQHPALGRKVSARTLVPLCRGHRREVDRSGDEALWVEQSGIDPIGAARTLRTETHPLRSGAEVPDHADGFASSDLKFDIGSAEAHRNRKTKPIIAARAQ